MQRASDARLQMLALALLALCGLFLLDLRPVQDVLAEVGLDGLPEAGAPDTADAPPPLRAGDGPSLAVGGEQARPRPCPLTAPELAIDTRSPDERDAAKAAAEQLQARMKDATTGKSVTVQLDGPGAIIPSIWVHRPDRIANLGDATRALDLVPAQVASWTRTVGDSHRALDDLRHVPGADGRSWHDVVADAVGGEDPSRAALALARALQRHLGSTLNGGETYLAARTRVLDIHRDLLRRDLTPEQQARFDALDVDPLLGAGRTTIALRGRVRSEP